MTIEGYNCCQGPFPAPIVEQLTWHREARAGLKEALPDGHTNAELSGTL